MNECSGRPTLCGPGRRAKAIISHFACGWKAGGYVCDGFSLVRGGYFDDGSGKLDGGASLCYDMR